jgi:hypothetical protein
MRMENAIFWDVTPSGSYKKRIASIIRVRIGMLETTSAVTRNRLHAAHSSQSPPRKSQILHSINRLGFVAET